MSSSREAEDRRRLLAEYRFSAWTVRLPARAGRDEESVLSEPLQRPAPSPALTRLSAFARTHKAERLRRIPRTHDKVTYRRHDKAGRRQHGSSMVPLPGKAIAAGRAAARGQVIAEPGRMAWRKTAGDNAAVRLLNRMLARSKAMRAA
jgi:hypothetical protein